MKNTAGCSMRAALAGLAMALADPSALAVDLAEFSFGTGVGTDLAQAVAPHLEVTPMVGRGKGDLPVPHGFVDLGGGNMGMQLLRSEGGYRFDFTLSAAPGWTFQVTDAHFAFRASNTAGSNRNISVRPNVDPSVTWYDTAGGDINVSDLGPGDFGWKSGPWAAFASRSDLQTLRVQLLLKGNSEASVAVFDRVLLAGSVTPVPEPPAALLAALGVVAVATVQGGRRRAAARLSRP